MEIKGLSMMDQMRMLKGVENIIPKRTDAIDGLQDKPAGGKKVSFGEFLAHQLEETNRLGIEAEKSIERSVTGEEHEEGHEGSDCARQ